MLHFNKNLMCVCLAFLALGLGELKAQSGDKQSTDSKFKGLKFGAMAGYVNSMVSTKTTIKISGTSTSTSASASGNGFFIGGFAEKKLSKKLGLQLGLNYQNVSSSGTSSGSLNINLLGNYYLFKRFSAELGFNYDMALTEGAKSGIGVIAGVGYDITDKIFVNVRYIPTFTDRGAAIKAGVVETKTEINNSFLQVGVGYRF